MTTPPDMTGPVMRRLGLTPPSQRSARRRRRRRGVVRLMLVLIAVGASAVCTHWYLRRTEPPAPAGPTIPAAIENDVLHHGHTIDRALRTIRDLSRWAAPALEPAQPPHPEVEEPADELREQAEASAARRI